MSVGDLDVALVLGDYTLLYGGCRPSPTVLGKVFDPVEKA